jgi:NAD(P)H-nitrite reductase large subunit
VWDRLLLATGSKSNRFGWPGQDLDGVHGLYDLPDLKRLAETCGRADHAVVVGGGLIGIELGEMLHSRGIGVTFLIREDAYWDNVLPREEAELVSRHIQANGMRLIRKRNLVSIEDDGRGRAAAVVDDTGERIACGIVGLTPGVSPNLDLVKGTAVETGRRQKSHDQKNRYPRRRRQDPDHRRKAQRGAGPDQGAARLVLEAGQLLGGPAPCCFVRARSLGDVGDAEGHGRPAQDLVA